MACQSRLTWAYSILLPAVLDRQHIFPRLAALPQGVCEAAMLAATRTLLQLAAEDSGITAHMRRLEYVATAGGGLSAPSELYDPR